MVPVPIQLHISACPVGTHNNRPREFLKGFTHSIQSLSKLDTCSNILKSGHCFMLMVIFSPSKILSKHGHMYMWEMLYRLTKNHTVIIFNDVSLSFQTKLFEKCREQFWCHHDEASHSCLLWFNYEVYSSWFQVNQI